jgi:hypothetical protein
LDQRIDQSGPYGFTLVDYPFAVGDLGMKKRELTDISHVIPVFPSAKRVDSLDVIRIPLDVSELPHERPDFLDRPFDLYGGNNGKVSAVTSYLNIGLGKGCWKRKKGK